MGTRALALLCALLAAAAGGVRAQDSPVVRDSTVARLVRLGRPVRVRAADGRVLVGQPDSAAQGRLHATTAAGAPWTLPYTAMDTIWRRGRATWTGAIVGAAAGAVGFGTFVAIVAHALCEVDCEDAALSGALIGGAIGLGGGGALGAVIGSAIPRWVRAWPGAGVPAPRPGRERFIGEAWLQAGGVAVRGRGTGPAVDGGLHFRLGRVTVGPEGGLFGTSECGGWRLGATGRMEFLDGPWRPFVVAGGGVTGYGTRYELPAFDPGTGAPLPAQAICDEDAYLSAILGGGLRWFPGGGRLGLQVEGRFYPRLAGPDTEEPPSHGSVGVGALLRW